MSLMSDKHYKKESISLIVTVLNEAATLSALLKSIAQQTLLPDELVIVDADSQDASQQLIKDFSQHSPIKVKLLVKAGNRSQGRNWAVKHSHGQWLAMTDAGCVLDKDWLAQLCLTQQQTGAEVVAGYYQALANNPLQQAIAPYFLVTSQRLKAREFLPATRSMLISRQLFRQLGGFAEHLAFAEDYALAKKMKQQQVNIAFARQALVYWLPPTNLVDFSKTVYQMAYYDVVAGVTRPKVYLIFARYLIFLGFCLFFDNLLLIFALTLIYLLWSIAKNYRNCPRAWYYLPLLQLLADCFVMTATLMASFKHLLIKSP